MRRTSLTTTRLLLLLALPGCALADRSAPIPTAEAPVGAIAALEEAPPPPSPVTADAARFAQPATDVSKAEAPLEASTSPRQAASTRDAPVFMPRPPRREPEPKAASQAPMSVATPMGGRAVDKSPPADSLAAGPERRKLARRGDMALAFDGRMNEAGGGEGIHGGFDVKEATSAGINPLVDARDDALSTFAIDVDTGSWTLAKRFLQGGALPNPSTVRVEEWVNAFSYSYDDPGSEHPFSIHMEGAPLARQSMVLRVGIQGKHVEKAEREPVHLTFLVDVSGSMSNADRLPLAKQALELLVGELNGKDSVSIVTYAGSTAVVLPDTRANAAGRARILDAVHGLRNGGGTNMGDGMVLAYQEATKALGSTGSSRVIVLSDGDANIGRTGHAAILQSIKGYVSEGVTMSTVGFGLGNYRETLMEQLADAGNGNYSYVGNLNDARKIFVEKLTGTLQVIAKDTKIQVEMNPDVVASYRLIGYENRDVADRDFRNDKVDAGEIGAGHTVTALYEVQLKDDEPKGDIATVRVRYKQPKGARGIETSAVFTASALQHDTARLSADGRFAAGVGLVAEALRHSAHMDRLGLSVADGLRLMESGVSGPHAAERREAVRLIAPLVEGAPVAWR